MIKHVSGSCLLTVLLCRHLIQRLLSKGKGLSTEAPEHVTAKFGKRGIGFAKPVCLIVPLARRTDHDVLRITIAAHIAAPLK